MNKYIPLIVAVVTTNAMSQILLKQGMNTIGKFDFGGKSLWKMHPLSGSIPMSSAASPCSCSAWGCT